MTPLPPKFYKELYELFASIKTPAEARLLLEDMETPQEIDVLAQRWQLIQQLLQGKPQRKIAEDLGISISKITRGSTMLQHGNGAFKLFHDRMKKRKK